MLIHNEVKFSILRKSEFISAEEVCIENTLDQNIDENKRR